MLQGPGENAGVIDLGERRGGLLQGREPQPPVRGRAVPGRGDRRRRDPARHHRDGRAAGGAPRRAALRAPATRASTAPSPGSAHYGNCVGVPDRRRRGRLRRGLRRQRASSTRCASACCPPTASRARGATGPGNLVVLYGATTGRDGIGGASVLASQELGEDDADKRPVRAGRRPVHRQEADRGLGRARRVGARRVAAGLRRRRARLLALRDGARRAGSTSTSTACRCARRGWSRGR